MNKSSKSRIPVPVTKTSSNLCNEEKTLVVKKVTSNLKTSNANKTAKTQLVQKKIEKTCSQPEKSISLKDKNVINLDFKNKQSSLKNSVRYDCIQRNHEVFVTNLKSNDKNKRIACKNNDKPNLGNKRITKASDAKANVNNRKILSSSETKMKSCIDETDENKKENLPSPKSYVFEIETCASKENQIISKEDCFPAQENVEFEANELYRKMILTNRALSPNVCNLRLSSLQCDRPSVYQKIEISNDPLKEALKALENTCLSVNRVKKEKESKKDELFSSPYRDRDSIYTPCGDPNKVFLKRLEDFKLNRSQKTVSRSTKKVTFNLNVLECTPKNTCDNQVNHLKNSEYRLMQINEKSEENTPISPQSEKKAENKLSNFASKGLEQSNISNGTNSANNEDSLTEAEDKDSVYLKCKETKTVNESEILSKNNHEILKTTAPNILINKNEQKTPLQNFKEISCHNSSPDCTYDSKKVEKFANCPEISKIQKRIVRSAKIYTPKPISLASKSELNQSYSPEFLVDRKSTVITNLAPICTPLVLKSQAKDIMFSPEADEGPIPLKLNFTEEDKDTPKKETYKNHTLVAFDHIVTTQKKMDDLADQECYWSLVHENFPVICGRYLTNPVAMILNEGDDMHFIPIHL